MAMMMGRRKGLGRKEKTLEDMSKNELIAVAKAMDLDTKGSKADLMKRIQESQ